MDLLDLEDCQQTTSFQPEKTVPVPVLPENEDDPVATGMLPDSHETSILRIKPIRKRPLRKKPKLDDQPGTSTSLSQAVGGHEKQSQSGMET